MPYVKKTVSYGNYIDFEFYHTKRQLNSLPEVRRPKFKETTAAQQEVNRRNAVVNLRRLICCNFVRDDLHLQLKYIRKSGEPYRTEDEMRKDIAFFHRKMRAEYRKKGIDYKYIHVMEIGIRGARHHHLIVNYIDPRIIRKHWPFARVTYTHLDGGDYKKLAAYLIKQSDELFRGKTLMKQRFNCSKGLKRPKVKKEVVKRAYTFRPTVHTVRDFHLVNGSEYFGADINGYVFFKYTMQKNE